MSNIEDFVIENGVLKKYVGPGGNVVIPEGVTEIADSAFSNCKRLSGTVIPETVIKIGSRCFSDCSSLISIKTPESLSEIGDEAFKNCAELNSITISQNTTKIGRDAFTGCKKLSIFLHGNTLHLDFNNIFNGHDYFTIYAPEISINNFSGAKLQKYVLLGFFKFLRVSDSLTAEQRDEYVSYIRTHKSIRKAAYKLSLDNKSIMQFLLGNSVIPSDEYEELLAFVTQKKSSTLIPMLQEYAKNNHGMKPNYSDTTEQAHSSAASIKLQTGPSAAELKLLWRTKKKADESLEIESYKGDDTKLIVPTEIGKGKITSIAAFAFSPNASRIQNSATRKLIRSVIIPEGITEIGDHAFDGCCKLETVELPQSLTCIGAYAFYNCSKLSKITLPKNLTQIAESAFSDCCSLSKITVPEKVEELGDNSFAGCSGLSEIRLSNGSIIIGKNALESFSHMQKEDSGSILMERSSGMLKHSASDIAAYGKDRDLGSYMKEHSIDSLALISCFEAALGLDATGSKQYILGEKTVKITVTSDLKISLLDETTGKSVKSLPKKNADPVLLTIASADLKTVKDALKYFAKGIYDLLFQNFLKKNEIKGSLFLNYCKNSSMVRYILRSIVLQQGEHSFLAAEDGFTDSDLTPYSVRPDEPVCIAHPMEMNTDDIESWQKYFASRKIVQPFAQIWEPVIDFSSIKEDRYKGISLKHYYFQRKEKRGIDSYFPSWAYYDGYVDFADCRCDTRIDEFSVEITSFKPDKQSRQANHIIAYLDSITVRERILKDDITIESFLSSFTLAQITGFLKLAMENNCPNVTALLLNYKNEHFADFDPMEEFTLGEL